MPGSFSQRPERASKNTGSPSNKHPHGISFLGWRRTSSRPRRAMNAHPRWGRRTQRALGAVWRTSAGWPMLPPGSPGDDGRVEIVISLDAIDPPVGRLRVASGPGSAPGRGDDGEFRFTGWLGLLRALYEVTGASAGGPPADP